MKREAVFCDCGHDITCWNVATAKCVLCERDTCHTHGHCFVQLALRVAEEPNDEWMPATVGFGICQSCRDGLRGDRNAYNGMTAIAHEVLAEPAQALLNAFRALLAKKALLG